MNIAHAPSDVLIRIKNASLAKRKEAQVPFSNMNKKILDLLTKEGFIRGSKVEEKAGRKTLKATIRYEKRNPVINGIKILSKPSLRVYKDKLGISKIERRGKHVVFVSTNLGIMTGFEAKKKGVGGEVLFEIW